MGDPNINKYERNCEQAKKQHKIIGQVFATYWLVEYKGELLIIDQHAAHERLLYDRMLDYSYGNIVCQPLLVPITIKTNPLEEKVIQECMTYLKNLGITLERTLDGKGYVVTMVPVELIDINFNKFSPRFCFKSIK